MKIKGRPLSHLPGRAMVVATDRLERVKLRLAGHFPGVFGLPVQGPFVQLYRHDQTLTTELSLFNYLSTFLPDIETRMAYRVVAYAANGKKIGTGSVVLEHGHTLQRTLQEIILQPLDRYGMFHVMAQPHSTDPKAGAAIGETSGQFMTLFYPRERGRHAPQLLHSHRPLQPLPILHSPVVRRPHITESPAALEQLQFFFLNPNPLRLAATLNIVDASNGAQITARSTHIEGFGVAEIGFDRTSLKSFPDTIGFEYGFDRQVSHMKPILFRTFAGGVVTSNHT